ncbi:BglG family transcription antiterminator [Pelolinea submarina]|uniref:BglG family transcription antiterminator n=1 Tax=Pelolinea submarina TaxID=913107 RepID=UPI000E29E28E|nr:PRD domain-containing protein [Pelolinea submarina]BBB48919.1 hypothetical protein Pelsub_P2150 [Pelolinea submarina]
MQLDLPARVIRYNLPYIEEWLNEEAVDFSLVHHNGLLLRISDKDRKDLVQKVNQEIPIVDIFSPEDRISLIIFDLLRNPDYCSGVELQSRLSVARSTITRDLKNVEAALAEKNIPLLREPHRGIKANGRLEDIRHALISLLFELDLESELLNFCIWGKATSGSNLNKLPEGSLQIIMQIFPWKIQDAWREVNRILQEIHATLSESIILYLALYWAIMKIHIQSGFCIEPDQEKLDLVKGTPEFEAVAASAEKLNKMTGLSLPEQEIVQFTMELLGSIRGGKVNSDQAGLFMQDQIAQEITDQLLERVGAKIDEDLNHPQVRQKLQDHISRQVLRIKLNLPIRNKLSEQIQYMYPRIWQATAESIQEINDGIGNEHGIRIPIEEANYLTMYMVLAKEMKDESNKGKRVIVVCPSGGITVWMVVSRLKSEFPEITIVDVVPIKRLSQVEKTKLDAIITTINIIDRDLPVIKVSPLLTNDDIDLIKEVLFDQGRNK